MDKWMPDVDGILTVVDRIAARAQAIGRKPPAVGMGFLGVNPDAVAQQLAGQALDRSEHRSYPPGLTDAVLDAALNLVDATPWFRRDCRFPLLHPHAFDHWASLSVDVLRRLADRLPHDTGASGMVVTIEAIGECARTKGLILEIVRSIRDAAYKGSEPARFFMGEVERTAQDIADFKSDFISKLDRMLTSDKLLESMTKKLSVADIMLLLETTPFGAALRSQIPVTIPRIQSHTPIWVIAPMGGGKTRILIDKLRIDLANGDGCLVFDTQLYLSDEILRHVVGKDKASMERVVYIDPTDEQYRPWINLCKVGGGIDGAGFKVLFSRIMQSMGIDLSGVQKALMGHIAQIVRVMPDPTLDELIQILDEDADGRISRYESRLPDHVNQWISKHWDSAAYKPTREAISRRFGDLRQSEGLSGMFGARDTNLDIKELLDAGKLVIVRLRKDILGEETAMVGTIFLALTLSAMWTRGKNDPRDWRIYLDEFQDFGGAGGGSMVLETFLDQGRKFRVGLVVAHQRISNQIAPSLLSGLRTNAQIRIFGQVKDPTDRTTMAGIIGCSPEQLSGLGIQPNGPDPHGKFMIAITGRIDSPVELYVPFNLRRKDPGRTDAEMAEFWTQLARPWMSGQATAAARPPAAEPDGQRVIQMPPQRTLGRERVYGSRRGG